MRDGTASGVVVRKGWRSEFVPADLVVLAAGGFETPKILRESGIECDERLFVDPVLCLAVQWKGSYQDNEIAMPFVVQQEGYILSPYLDYLSYFFKRDWKNDVNDTLSLMIKIADSTVGNVTERRVEKTLTERDRERIKYGTETCCEIFERMGIRRSNVVLGTLNAGHPGGMLALSGDEVNTFHPSRLPANLYVADASLIPTSLGNPPIFTIMALAKRVSRACKAGG
jgi:choline dehydrogenase-like flavoprotein